MSTTIKGWKLAIHERECFKCKICGSSYQLTVHHKIPLAKGGKSNPDNCVCWCHICHNLFHKRYGLTTSDDLGNPVGKIIDTRVSRPSRKKRCKKLKKKHRR